MLSAKPYLLPFSPILKKQTAEDPSDLPLSLLKLSLLNSIVD